MLNQVSLSNIVHGALTTLQPKLQEKRIQVSENSAEIVTPVLTDEHLLEQMLYNLLLNALEASPKGAEIYLQCRLKEQTLLMTIEDQGSGMPFTPDPHSTTPGPTTKRFGTGLGIPFAFKVCEELGGTLSYSSRVDRGTTVVISLPQ